MPMGCGGLDGRGGGREREREGGSVEPLYRAYFRAEAAVLARGRLRSGSQPITTMQHNNTFLARTPRTRFFRLFSFSFSVCLVRSPPTHSHAFLRVPQDVPPPLHVRVCVRVCECVRVYVSIYVCLCECVRVCVCVSER